MFNGLFNLARQIYFKKIIAQIKSGDRVLDIGCGRGKFLDICKKKNIKAIGVDKEKCSVDFCRQYGLEAMMANVYKLPFSNNSFSFIICQSVVEHLNQPLKGLREIKRILKKGGVFIVSVPTPEGSFWDDPTHIRPYTSKSIISLLEMVGFKNVQCSYVIFYLFGLKICWNWFYQVINLLPFPFGGNLICKVKND